MQKQHIIRLRCAQNQHEALHEFLQDETRDMREQGWLVVCFIGGEETAKAMNLSSHAHQRRPDVPDVDLLASEPAKNKNERTPITSMFLV
jgi:hypothetical protein